MRSIHAFVFALLAFLANPAVADEECRSQEETLGALAKGYGETLWGSGAITENNKVFTSYFLKNGWSLEAGDRLFVISNPLGHTWTFAVQKKGARHLCVVANGTHSELAARGDAIEFEGTSGFKFWFSKNLKTGEWALTAAWVMTQFVTYPILRGTKWDLAPPHVRWQLKGPKI